MKCVVRSKLFGEIDVAGSVCAKCGSPFYAYYTLPS